MTVTYFTRNNIVKQEQEDIDFSLKMKNAIEVELIDQDLYMSRELWLPYGSRGAYGGQIVAQALRAAWNTVPDDFFIHSLHCYFILACNTDIPVIYSIQRIRDGKSFSTRIVKATQRGKAIFTCSYSFVKLDENTIDLHHQTDMPKVLDPETLPSDIELLQKILDNNIDKVPEKFKNKSIQRIKDSLPVDYRSVNQLSVKEVMTGKIKPNPNSRQWFKTRGELTNEDLKVHTCVIAYASDSGLLTTSAAANGLTTNSISIGMIASLDHSIWFHVPSRADEWLLYDVHSPKSTGGRGMAFGKIYNRQGVLVASVAQEGIVRLSHLEQQKRENKL